ncbi:MAG: 50S ribosomal protein L16, partial [Enterobacteriaceae bacterium]|nr:50S ribosomal protein L16 [Enterobacteriaceae bacterium]
PKKVKYRKQQRGSMKGIATRSNEVAFGEYGLKSLDRHWITSRQIEAARRVITHHLARGGKIWIRIFPDKPITEKPIEVRQGKGKGNVEYWVSLVQPGKVLFEVAGVSYDVAYRALKLASYKLPVKTVFVSRVML